MVFGPQRQLFGLFQLSRQYPLFHNRLATHKTKYQTELFIDARDAYLAGDWLKAETKLQTILTLSPTDGEAQLLFGTLLRRVGRFDEAKKSLEKLARSDSGQLWQHAIHHRLSLIKRDLKENSEELNVGAEAAKCQFKAAACKASLILNKITK